MADAGVCPAPVAVLAGVGEGLTTIVGVGSAVLLGAAGEVLDVLAGDASSVSAHALSNSNSNGR